MRGRRGEKGSAEVVIRESWESRCGTVTHTLMPFLPSVVPMTYRAIERRYPTVSTLTGFDDLERRLGRPDGPKAAARRMGFKPSHWWQLGAWELCKSLSGHLNACTLVCTCPKTEIVCKVQLTRVTYTEIYKASQLIWGRSVAASTCTVLRHPCTQSTVNRLSKIASEVSILQYVSYPTLRCANSCHFPTAKQKRQDMYLLPYVCSRKLEERAHKPLPFQLRKLEPLIQLGFAVNDTMHGRAIPIAAYMIESPHIIYRVHHR